MLGALLLTWIVGLENDVYFQVGLVTLVGLSAKNAILICEFAIERVRAGMAPREAAIEAAGLRLRAIVMTSLAFGLGCVPLAIATGPGANSLRAIGTGVIGGIIASTVIAVIFAPLFFWLLESMSQRFAPPQERTAGRRRAGRRARRMRRLASAGPTERCARDYAIAIAANRCAAMRVVAAGVHRRPRLREAAGRHAARLAHRLPAGSRRGQHALVGALRRSGADGLVDDALRAEPAT